MDRENTGKAQNIQNSSDVIIDPATEPKQDDIITNQTNGSQKTQLVDSSGEQVGVTNNNLDVHTADTHFKLINRHVMNFTGTTSNFAGAVSAGATSFDVDDASGFSVGDGIFISEGNIEETDDIEIISISSNTITVNYQLDNTYTTAGQIEKIEENMSLNIGSLASPISFIIQPPSNETWHILRIIIFIEDEQAMDDSKFGGITNGITNGVHIRENKSQDRTLSFWQTNGDIAEDTYDVTYTDKVGGGNFGLRGRWTPKKVDVVVKLDGSLSEKLEVLIQDDLTGLVDFKMKAQGHIEGA